MPAPSDKEITSSERIKRIFGILRLDGREMELHLPKYIEVAKISNTTHGTFTLKLSNPLIDLRESSPEYVYINFIFSGVELFGKCMFIEQSRAFLTLGYPESLKSRTKRKYPRVRFNRSVPIELKYKEYPEMQMERFALKDVPVKYSQLYWEAQRDKVDIKKVFLMGLREIRAISPYSEIVVYSQKNMSQRDARIIRKSGKVLFIDECRKAQSYTQLIPSDKMITYSYHLNDMKVNGANPEELTKELQDIIVEDLSNEYTSKVLVPIYSKDGIIGHILMYQKDLNKKITPENISDLIAISTLFSIGIENAHFITNIEELVGSSLLNISEGGLLLKIKYPESKVNIPEGAGIEVRFMIGENEVIMKGNVCRRDKDSLSYAIKFTELPIEDKQLLRKFIEANIEKIRDQ